MRFSKAALLIAVLALFGAAPPPAVMTFQKSNVDIETLRGPTMLTKMKNLRATTIVRLGKTDCRRSWFTNM